MGREAAVGTGFAAKGRRSRGYMRLLNSRLTRERNSGQLSVTGGRGRVCVGVYYLF
jgi:hypothetical protein